MKAFLINPYQQTITEVNDDFNGDYRLIYKHLSEPGQKPVTCFDTRRISNRGDTVFVDDEGLMYAGTPTWTFRIWTDALAGRGLILGTNMETGDSADPSPEISVEWIKAQVVWTALNTTGDVGPVKESVEDHPWLGKAIPTITVGPAALAHPEQEVTPEPSFPYPRTAEEWWAQAAYVAAVAPVHGYEGAFDHMRQSALQGAIERRDGQKAWRTVNAVWRDAPDAPRIHGWPAWERLCDLCSEGHLVLKEKA